MKRILVAIFSVLLVLGAYTSIFAQEEVLSKTEGETEEVSSFEIFWPVAAGKTKGDSLYFLKTLKEDARGLLIFGKPQKADYLLFLTTKRVVEAEKLLNDGKKDLALETLDVALVDLDLVGKNIAESGGDLKSAVDEINNKLSNLEKFLPWLISKNQDSSDKLQKVLDKVKDLHTKV